MLLIMDAREKKMQGIRRKQADPPLSPTKKPTSISVLVALLIILFSIAGYVTIQNIQLQRLLAIPANYDECTKAKGSLIRDSYPPTCITTAGKRFTGPVTTTDLDDRKPASDDATTQTGYTCPTNGYVDCTTNTKGPVKYECTPQAYNWYEAHCSDF